MRLMPKDKEGRITFCQTRLAPWAERAEQIGTTPERVAELATLTEAARAAYREQRLAQQAARDATLRLKLAMGKMSNAAQAIIMQVRTKAILTGEAVYPIALISPPDQASPIAAPGQPTRFEAELQQSGRIILTWACKNPRGSQGTIYQVWRSLDGGEMKYIGNTGKKKFADDAVPPGNGRIVYRVRAERSTRVGEWAHYNLNLGTPKDAPKSIIPAVATQRNAA